MGVPNQMVFLEIVIQKIKKIIEQDVLLLLRLQMKIY